jgi:non-heme chloroperoxidase
MNPTRIVGVATWMLEHLTFGRDIDALSGDLLEEFRAGRSAGWVCRQVLMAVWVGLGAWAREFALALVYSSGWSTLYPLWRILGRNWLFRVALDRWVGLGWPYSTVMDLADGILPAITFVWLGLLVYLILRSKVLRSRVSRSKGFAVSPFRLFLGLSTSVSVLLAATIGLLFHLKHPVIDVKYITAEAFYSMFLLFGIRVPLALSLLVAILCAVSCTPRLVRRQRISQSNFGPVMGFHRGMYHRQLRRIAILVMLSAAALHGQPTASSPHSTEQFVTVEKDVKLQVLDWGGTGRALIFMSGLGDDAHVFDKFAPQFTSSYHVYGITRRGFGASSKPVPANGNYSADRLGDDVLAVIDALKIDRPVLVGHSIAGEELSSIGSRHPEKISGLIYLEAGMGYAYYDPDAGWIVLDMLDLKKMLDQFQDGAMQDEKQFLNELLASTMRFEKDMQQMAKETVSTPGPAAPLPSRPPIIAAIQFGEQRYSQINVPILAIFAIPHNFDGFKGDADAKAALIAADFARNSAQANAFERGLPSAHVVRLANASHYVFKSNAADVVREMNDFLAKLP